MSEKTGFLNEQMPKDGRKVYYKHYTNRNWGEAENYDVCLDSGTLGVDKCVEIVCDIAQMK